MTRLARTVAVGVVLAAAALALFGARPAAATARRPLHVSLTHPDQGSYPGIAAPLGDLPYSVDNGDAHSCATDRSAVCDEIPVTIDLPPASRTENVFFNATLSWADPQNRLYFSIQRTDTDRDGASYSVGMRRSTTGVSPEPLQVINPTTSTLQLVIINIDGVNHGYHVDVSLTREAIVLPHDYSRDGATPPPAANATDSTNAGATSPAPAAVQPGSNADAFPTGGALAIRGRTLTAARASRHGNSTPWAAGSAAVVALALTTGVLIRRRASGDRSAPASSPRVRIRRWAADVRLFWKLLLPFFLIILVGGGTAAFLTVGYLNRQAGADLDRSLVQKSVTATAFVRDREAFLLDSERFAANIEGLPEAVAGGDRAATTRALTSALSVSQDLDLLAATDPNGTGVVELTRQGQTFQQTAGSPFGSVPLVVAALHNPSAAISTQAGVLQVAGTDVLAVAGPVRTGTVVGAMVAGLRLDTLAQAVDRRAGAAVAIYGADGRLVSASRAGMAATAPTGALTTTDPVRRDETVAGRRARAVYAPLDVRDTRIGSLAVSLPSGPAFASVRGARVRLTLILLAVMASVVALGGLVSRSVLRRLTRLLDTNRALGSGDLSVRAPVEGHDELGELAEGFNVMAEQLEASYAEMERRVVDRTEELQRLYQDVVRGNEARSDLFAAISHEFRTPLFAILAHAELMADPRLRPKGRQWPEEFASTISESAQVLLRRVNDILELAKLEGTDFALDLEPVAIADAVDAVTRQVRALARQAGLTLDIDVDADLPPVLADNERVQQILLNLLSNAVKYNRDGGRVVLTARAVPGAVEIAVADTGNGIPAEVGDRIFEPFYQVRGATTTQPARLSSSGLGLAVTKRLVEGHHGTLGFESSVGKGTTFTVTLPTA